MRTTGKNKSLKLIAACSVAIFSLGSICAGAYAWFTLEMKQTLGTTDFAVVNVGTCNLYSMELVKFNYDVHQYGSTYIVDYSSPEAGTVNRYQYSNDYNSFGYDDGTWHPVSMMNLYDPVSLTLSGDQLSSLNCNSIYQFTVSSLDLTEAKLDSYVRKIIDTDKEEDDLFLTTCTDFDIYFDADLLDTNPAFGDDHKAYYPSYITDKTVDLSDDEELYYKISYLSSLADSHANLYDGDGSIGTEIPVEFIPDSTSGENYLTFYINVNYAPSQLVDTMYHIYRNNINAICDFGFYFYFLQEGDE